MTGEAGGCFEAGGGTDEHTTKSGCKSSAVDCNIVSGACDGGIAAMEEVKGGLLDLVAVEGRVGGMPRPPELLTGEA